MIKLLPQQAELKAVFEYDPETGILTRDGKKVGCKGNGCGYTVKYNYVLYRAARIIWCLQTGEDPGEMYVDHINRDPYDNRWENLRLVTQLQNQRNRSANGNIEIRSNGDYRAWVCKKSKVFEHYDLACEWVEKTKREMFGDYAPA